MPSRTVVKAEALKLAMAARAAKDVGVKLARAAGVVIKKIRANRGRVMERATKEAGASRESKYHGLHLGKEGRVATTAESGRCLTRGGVPRTVACQIALHLQLLPSLRPP
jgi:hypothetical protein